MVSVQEIEKLLLIRFSEALRLQLALNNTDMDKDMDIYMDIITDEDHIVRSLGVFYLFSSFVHTPIHHGRGTPR